MRILSISAQKPNSTGSGVYLTELVKGFQELGHEQAVLAGIYEGEEVELPEEVEWFPVYFKTKELPFPIAGMSDEMPYESTVYSQMTEEMQEQFIHIFEERLTEAKKSFQPDLILCHHLYLLTSVARHLFPEAVVAGICHGSDLRQIQKNEMQRAFMMAEIKGLNLILALHEEQRKEIIRIYGCDASKVMVTGTGYNQQIFYPNVKPVSDSPKGDSPIRLIYAGKLSEKKGVMSLIRSLSHLSYAKEDVVLYLAGGYGNEAEYQEIQRLASAAEYQVVFLGKLSQPELAEQFRRSDIFVLPSFFEGLPLVIIEALACGLKVVTTELPGVRPWMEQHVAGDGIQYVVPPQMNNTDEPVCSELPAYEKRLAEAIADSAARETEALPELSHISWKGICRKIIEYIDK